MYFCLNFKQVTLSEEDYIKVIYHLGKGKKTAVSTNSIAEKMVTKPSSVSDMVRKLSDKGLVNYKKYKGVSLTELGTKTALNLVRKHRLWEVFLVDKLDFTWDEVHEVAEQLEHIKSSLLISRLDEFLDFPKFDPHGDPIPDAEGIISSKPRLILSEIAIGTKVELVSMKDTGNAFLNYLDKIGMKIGTKILISDVFEFDGSVEIELDERKKIAISKQVADNLLVITR